MYKEMQRKNAETLIFEPDILIIFSYNNSFSYIFIFFCQCVFLYLYSPMSHLFHSLHEQSYVAHAMGFASCGKNQEIKLFLKDKHPFKTFKAINELNLCQLFLSKAYWKVLICGYN
ncbi:hypothetical protein Anas_04543 [Armadillidium nasatum]|uniref:Uncharacterized protein n=1 Tax=Armadillidium nasatum TaxID=96803 RepID=A0A5N5SS18_9CRUS|nr:hypothetical protein Anas_04543 [Armadillidium nasatum]